MISRRNMLGAVAVTSMPLSAVAAPPAAQSPEERLDAAISVVIDCLRKMNPDHPEANILTEQQSSYLFVGIKVPPKPVEWSGPDFYEIEQGDGRPIYWIDRIDYKTRSGHYYRAVSRWKGRDERKPIRIQAADLQIVRKRADFAGRQ